MRNEDKNIKNLDDFKSWKQLFHYFSESFFNSTNTIQNSNIKDQTPNLLKDIAGISQEIFNKMDPQNNVLKNSKFITMFDLN